MFSVSVIIPVFNDVAGIRTALKSLVQQSLPKDRYEIIVVDNNSTDGTFEAVEVFAKRSDHTVTLTRERKQGAYASRNRGIRAAKGEILAFTDADCVPLPDWVERGMDSLADTGAAFAAGRIDMTYGEKRPNVWEYFDAARKLNQQVYVEKAGFGATANLFVRRRLFETYGLFRSDLQSGGDYEFGRRLTTSGERLVYSDKAVVSHPARATFAAIFKKSRRIALGQKQLDKMGLLAHGRLSIGKLKPVRGVPVLRHVPLTRKRRLVLLAVANFFNYYNLFQRLRLG